jgi:methylamine methyltransferase corrinoid protein reductive activase
MDRFVIAMDLGTSGFRAQAIDRSSHEIRSSVVSVRHALPGANVTDHLQFAMEVGADVARDMMIRSVNRLVARLQVPPAAVDRFAVCGNPIQLSLFQGIEIRDLAYAGTRKLESLGIVPPIRDAAIVKAREVTGLELPAECDVLIPPAVRHEVGADALAMIIQSGMLENDEISLATDYGTNAEMALHCGGRVITGSTAAGPALEGRHIACGMLAVPGAISDLNAVDHHHRLTVLSSEMLPDRGRLVRLDEDHAGRETGAQRAVGITGTGVVAVIQQAVAAGLIAIPRINTADHSLHLGEGIYFTETDLVEAGKAIGSIRSGHITLCHEAGISLNDIKTAYMSGASGTYVDAIKAQALGMIPPRVETVHQVGNTSLAMARDVALDPGKLDLMADTARTLREDHCLFAASDIFRKVYILDLSHWTEGMPMSQYDHYLARYGLPRVLPVVPASVVSRRVKRDIGDIGRAGLELVTDLGSVAHAAVAGCTACSECVEQCPGGALSLVAGEDPPVVSLDCSLCEGMACLHCETACKERVFEWKRLFNASRIGANVSSRHSDL